MSYALVERLEESRFQNLPLYGLQTLEQLCEVLEIDDTISWASSDPSIEAQYHCFYKTQSNGKRRYIEAPSEGFKTIQHRIKRIFEQEEPPPYLSSPVKGRSHISNASAHRYRFEVICMDVAQFFRSCSANSVYRMFRERLHCSHDVSLALTLLTCFQDHLATGSPCSPLIAFYANEEMFHNIYLSMGDLLCRVSLWVDDLSISVQYQDLGIPPQELVEIVENWLLAYGFRSNRKKTRIYLSNRAANITGIILTADGELRMPNRLHHRLKQTNERIKTSTGYEKQRLKQRSEAYKQLKRDIERANRRRRRTNRSRHQQ